MINGKGMYLWLLTRSEDIRWIVWLAKHAGLGHVLIKIADGTELSIGDITQLVESLHLEGIQAIGWQYIYYGSIAEADTAIRLCQQFGIDGFIVNAENQFDHAGMDGAARNYMSRLRSGLGDDFVIGLSSYRYPSQHADFPWKSFLTYCNINMPQVYWIQDERLSAPVRQSIQCVNEFKALYTTWGWSIPILMTGAAFSEHGWVASPEQVKNFLDAVNALADKESIVMRSCNFWEWWEARTENPSLWPIISQYEWSFTPMSDFNQWAEDVTLALRSQDFTISDPPITCLPDPETFQVRFDNTVNLRKTAGGTDIGDVKGLVLCTQPTQKAPYSGIWYEWAQVIEPAQWAGGWVAIDLGVRV